ncbi:MAG: tetratricopeptide repeat protein [Gammaproteobacteria bacterium]|nr:tetratricopeptide repeat protein [Gammaproteobacteria bacterium]
MVNGELTRVADCNARASSTYADATRELQSGNLGNARDLAAALADRFPESAAAWSLRAAVATTANDFKQALVYIEIAERLDTNSAGILAHKANTLAVLRMYEEARSCADKALRLHPVSVDIMATLGTAYTKTGDFDKSLACFQSAVHQAPDSATHQYNLGTALRFSGEFQAAEKCFDRTIKYRPRDYETYYARSGLRTQTADNNHVEEMEALLHAGSFGWRDEMLLCYALAKELEDLQQWDRSFNYLKRGANCRRKNMRYDVERDCHKMQVIADAIGSKHLLSKTNGYHSSEPIFVLGLPRAGSTLVERILSSHSGISSAGELQNFAIELMRPIYAKAGTIQIPIEELVTATLDSDFTALGKAYLESTAHLSGKTAHFTDKMPQNFLYVGLIHMALPHSKIIHVYRHPMDACYSMYKMIFKAAYPFSYDLDDLSRYYVAYDRLMKHWNEVLPGRILNICYEDLVHDQETETRKLLAYCDLEWEDQCMSFHELNTVATTASAVEVRSPIYSSSIHKWKNYSKQLDRVKQVLGRQGIVA